MTFSSSLLFKHGTKQTRAVEDHAEHTFIVRGEIGVRCTVRRADAGVKLIDGRSVDNGRFVMVEEGIGTASRRAARL